MELEVKLLISAGVGAIFGGNWGWLCIGIFMLVHLMNGGT